MIHGKIQHARTEREEFDDVRRKLIDHYMNVIRMVEDERKPDTLEGEMRWERHLISRYRTLHKETKKEERKYALA